jgi:hypothetical protein
LKLALFTQNLTQAHKQKLATYFNKPLAEVKFLYINTPGNYKPYKSKWMIFGEKKWEEVFPLFQEFDLERAFRVDPNFNFEEFLGSYDFIYTSGGSAYILSYWMKKTGSFEILKKLVLENKVVYGGESSGAAYAYKNLEIYREVDSHPEKAPERVDEGLGLIDFAPIPHWQNQEFQTGLESIKNKFEAQGIKTYTMTDDEGLFVEDGKISIIS